MGAQNHYQVLGVSLDADATQIRAAYVSLLKRYHPDQASVHEGVDNAPKIERIIHAYRVLKDPASRNQYDATLRPAARPSSRPNGTPPPFARAIPRTAPPFHWDLRRTAAQFKLDPEAISYAVMLVVAAIGLHLIVSRIIQEPRAAAKARPGVSSVREIAASTQLEAAVRNAGMMSRAEARTYSSRCFAASRLGRDAVATDTCMSFDMAYVYWRDTVGGPLADDPYFQPQAMESRFRSALGRLKPSRATARVQAVRAATLKAIMQTPRPTDDFGFALSETRPRAAPQGDRGILSRD
jgi:curved DNA-binding protein CbpA